MITTTKKLGPSLISDNYTFKRNLKLERKSNYVANGRYHGLLGGSQVY